MTAPVPVAAARSNWRSLGRDFPDEDAAAAREEVLTGDAVLAILNRRNDAVGRAWGEGAVRTR